MTAESDALEKIMQNKLDQAANASCSPEGHQSLIEFLQINNQLDIEVRKDIKRIRELAEAKGSIFANIPWGKPVKATGIGGVLATLGYIIAKVHGWIP